MKTTFIFVTSMDLNFYPHPNVCFPLNLMQSYNEKGGTVSRIF